MKTGSPMRVFFVREGILRFAASDKSHAASLLALTSVINSVDIGGFDILVPASNKDADEIRSCATELIRMSGSRGVKLSQREREVLGMLRRHKLTKEIADGLHICERTVKFHVSNLIAKFGVRSRYELVEIAGVQTTEAVQ